MKSVPKWNEPILMYNIYHKQRKIIPKINEKAPTCQLQCSCKGTSARFLSDPGVPGARSMDPVVSNLLTHWEGFCRLNWCDSGWWRYQLIRIQLIRKYLTYLTYHVIIAKEVKIAKEVIYSDISSVAMFCSLSIKENYMILNIYLLVYRYHWSTPAHCSGGGGVLLYIEHYYISYTLSIKEYMYMILTYRKPV